MLYSLHILDYLDPINTVEISNDEEYNDGQVGKLIQVYEEDFPDLLQADILLVGCREERGSRRSRTLLNGPDMIRRQFYKLYHWHTDIRLVDVGNIKTGSTLTDTYAALRSVMNELINLGKTVIILGGSHDLTPVSYTHLRAHETDSYLVCRLLLEKKK